MNRIWSPNPTVVALRRGDWVMALLLEKLVPMIEGLEVAS
jgi:hypothetical protein